MSKAATQAQKEIKYISSLLRGLTEFSDELEKVGTVDKIVQDREIEVSKLNKQIDVLKDEVTKQGNVAVQEKDLLRQQAERITASARKESDKILDEARKGAAQIVGEARMLAAEAQDSAKNEAGKARAEAEKAVSEANSHLAEAVAEGQRLEKLHEELTAALKTGRDELSTLKTELARIKSLFRE